LPIASQFQKEMCIYSAIGKSISLAIPRSHDVLESYGAKEFNEVPHKAVHSPEHSIVGRIVAIDLADDEQGITNDPNMTYTQSVGACKSNHHARVFRVVVRFPPKVATLRVRRTIVAFWV
jgi:hypothetical protein